jgi:hypothetical protein
MGEFSIYSCHKKSGKVKKETLLMKGKREMHKFQTIYLSIKVRVYFIFRFLQIQFIHGILIEKV